MTATSTKPQANSNYKAAPATPQAKFATARQEMADALVEREGEIDLVLTALLAGENPLMVGDPGTAKSMLITSLLAWMPGLQKFDWQLNKFTAPEELFGPVSLPSLKAGRYERVTTGKLPTAHLAFLDEIFKASSAILNTTLRALNEHVYENGSGPQPIPLRLCMAAANEWPSDQEGGKELGALFDRFLLRKKVKPISSRAGRDRLLNLARINGGKPALPNFSCHLTLEELDQAQAEALELEWTEEAEAGYSQILDTLIKEGIRPGDRRMYKALKCVNAYAYLCGAQQCELEHLEVLQYILWNDPTEQPEKCAQVVAKIANPVGMAVNSLLLQAEDVIAKATPAEAVPKLKTLQDAMKKLKPDARRDRAIQHLAGEIKKAYNRVIGVDME